MARAFEMRAEYESLVAERRRVVAAGWAFAIAFWGAALASVVLLVIGVFVPGVIAGFFAAATLIAFDSFKRGYAADLRERTERQRGTVAALKNNADGAAD